MPRRSPAPAWPTNRASDGTLVPRRRDCVQGVEIDSESVLYDRDNERFHLLNWSASAVWWSIDGKTTADELARALSEAFNAPRQALRDDVFGLLAMLGTRGLIEPVRSRPSEARNV